MIVLKIKKILSVLVGGVVLVAGTACFANVSDDAIVLGSVAPGSSFAAVRAQYPDIRQIDEDTFVISDGFAVDVDEHRLDIVDEVKVYSDNGIKTPAGVGVGSPEHMLNNVYGKADKVDFDSDDTEYVYYNVNRTKKMEFKVVGGVIIKITCEMRN